jgi:hypothetical protein
MIPKLELTVIIGNDRIANMNVHMNVHMNAVLPLLFLPRCTVTMYGFLVKCLPRYMYVPYPSELPRSSLSHCKMGCPLGVQEQ